MRSFFTLLCLKSHWDCTPGVLCSVKTFPLPVIYKCSHNRVWKKWYDAAANADELRKFLDFKYSVLSSDLYWLLDYHSVFWEMLSYPLFKCIIITYFHFLLFFCNRKSEIEAKRKQEEEERKKREEEEKRIQVNVLAVWWFGFGCVVFVGLVLVFCLVLVLFVCLFCFLIFKKIFFTAQDLHWV